MRLPSDLCARHDFGRGIGLVRNLNRNIDGNGTRLGIEQQRKAHHADQHQHGSANEAVARAATHVLHALALRQTAGALGASHRLSVVFLARPTEIEKCHEFGLG